MKAIYQIYIEENLIDLDPSTVISITLQASDFASGDLISRKSSFTNQIKVPPTNRNRIILEYSDNPKSKSTLPYKKKAAKIFSNGILIMEGVCILKQFDTFFNLQFYSLRKDLAFRVANLYLSDIDFGDSPITWNAAFIDSKRASTSGWCAPVLNYGQMDPNDVTGISIGTYYLPSVSYKDTLTAIFSNAGYTVSGTFYSNDQIFNNMILTYGRNNFPSTTLSLNEALSTTILQSDFIKDFLIKFGAFLRIRNNDIEIVTLEQILNNTSNALDWTNKRVKNKKDIIQYSWSGLAKQNNFLYNDIDNVPSEWAYFAANNPEVNGSLDIDNEILEGSTDIYTSLFEQPNYIDNGASNFPRVEGFTNAITAGVVHCVTSSIWPSTALPASYTFQDIPKPMLALLDAKHASEAAVKYNGSSRTDYKVARFKPDATWSTFGSLAWKQSLIVTNDSGFLNLYYPSIQRLFDAGLITTTHEYNLTDIDVNSFDNTIPIFDDGNYYLVNKVNNYVSGKTTRVELLKI